MKYRLRSVLPVNMNLAEWFPNFLVLLLLPESFLSSAQEAQGLDSEPTWQWFHTPVSQLSHPTGWRGNTSPSWLGCPLLLGGARFIFVSLFSNEWNSTHYLFKNAYEHPSPVWLHLTALGRTHAICFSQHTEQTYSQWPPCDQRHIFFSLILSTQ